VECATRVAQSDGCDCQFEAWLFDRCVTASWLQLLLLTEECYLYVRLATIIAAQVGAELLSVAWLHLQQRVCKCYQGGFKYRVWV
jgi:hypothetical protein